MHELTIGIKHTVMSPHTAVSPLTAFFVALSWLSVCLLVLGTGLIVLVSRLIQISLDAVLQIVRA